MFTPEGNKCRFQIVDRLNEIDDKFNALDFLCEKDRTEYTKIIEDREMEKIMK